MSQDWRTEEPRRSSRLDTTGARSVALFLLGIVALSPPLMSIFSVDTRVLGVPLLYLYLFLAWGALIALVRLAARPGAEPPRPDTEPE
ncbi:MAG: hypothetical protein IH900_00880 [Proteobacteria bacterium]|nr:hypothetical protein [Pseudomonadota bacterium]